MFNYIKKLGIELEGGWNSVPEWEENEQHIVSDGSVRTEARLVGELHYCSAELENVCLFLKECFPTTPINGSMGLHVHLSFKELNSYRKLAESSFKKYFLSKMKEYAKIDSYDQFLIRLKGENDYCKNKWLPHKQLYQPVKGGERYTFINFCYTFHGTLEVRVLPVFPTYQRSINAVKYLANVFESYLDSVKESNVEMFKELEIEQTFNSNLKSKIFDELLDFSEEGECA